MGREDRCGQQETKGGTTTTSERPPPSSDKRERGPSNPPRCFSHVPFVVESQPSFATTISRIPSPASQSWSQPSTSHADLANIPRKDASAFLDRAASSASICFFSALTDPSAGSSVSRIAYAFLTSPGGATVCQSARKTEMDRTGSAISPRELRAVAFRKLALTFPLFFSSAWSQHSMARDHDCFLTGEGGGEAGGGEGQQGDRH